MMGASLKEEDGTVTLQIKCDGPLNMLVVVANSHGEVKGYVENPIVDIPLKENGKLDVGGAIGNGVLGVIKDLKLKRTLRRPGSAANRRDRRRYSLLLHAVGAGPERSWL